MSELARCEHVVHQPDPTLLARMGGVSGLMYASLPSIAFAVADAITGLTVAIAVAVGTGAGIAALRLLRKEPVQPAISGLLGVALAVFIAYQTGSAKDFYLVGIWASLAMSVVLLASVLVRWPMAGVIWSLLKGSGHTWRADGPTRFGYSVATIALVVVFGARFVVQQWLYLEDSTGWLAFARVAMGYPLTALAGVVLFWAIRRADKRLALTRPLS